MRLIAVGAALALCLLGAACATAARPDNAAIVRDFQEHRSLVEVTAEGDVERLLPDQAGPSGPHQRFVVRLSSAELAVLVEHNVSIGRRVPLREGERVIVHGEYVWNAEGGLIHFTHHDPQRTHEGGFIERGGMRYE